MTPLVEPTKDWPRGVAQTVCSRVDDPNRQQRPEPEIRDCADCGASIVLHGDTVRFSALKYPGLPIRTIRTRMRGPSFLFQACWLFLSVEPSRWASRRFRFRREAPNEERAMLREREIRESHALLEDVIQRRLPHALSD